MNRHNANGNAHARKSAQPPKQTVSPASDTRNASEPAKSPAPRADATCIAAPSPSSASPQRLGCGGNGCQRWRSLHKIHTTTAGTTNPCPMSSSVHHCRAMPIRIEA